MRNEVCRNVQKRDRVRCGVVVEDTVERGGQPLDGKNFDLHPPPVVSFFSRTGKSDFCCDRNSCSLFPKKIHGRIAYFWHGRSLIGIFDLVTLIYSKFQNLAKSVGVAWSLLRAMQSENLSPAITRTYRGPT